MFNSGVYFVVYICSIFAFKSMIFRDNIQTLYKIRV